MAKGFKFLYYLSISVDLFHKHLQEISGSDFTYAVLTIFEFAAYYSRGCDSRELFIGKKIEGAPDFTEHLNRYDVILLNMQHFLIEADSGKVTEYLAQEVIEDLQKQYLDFLRNLLKDQSFFEEYTGFTSWRLKSCANSLI